MKKSKNVPTAEAKVKEKQQQQILFSESELEPISSQAPNQNSQQVVFDNEDYLPAQIGQDYPSQLDEFIHDDLADVDNSKTTKPRWLWRIIFTLLACVVTVEAVDFFINGFSQSPIMTSIYAVILSCLVLISSTVIFREFSGLRQFKRRQKLKQQAAEVLTLNNDKAPFLDVAKFCQKITANLPCDIQFEQEQAWTDAIESEHSDTELLQLYSRLVLSKVDEKALSEVAKFSTEAVVLVALSPVAIIDMLIILWRNLRMIDKVAGLYGLKLGYWSRIKLIKQVFVNMVYAGASELIADFGTEMIGADLLGKLSGRLAQGLGAGMLTARLGVKTMQLCRPIPFNDKPKLGHVRQKMLSTVKGLLSKSK
ncbi:MAG: YcjF family protein [Colwellia sp.]